jgi:hypothetical protein
MSTARIGEKLLDLTYCGDGLELEFYAERALRPLQEAVNKLRPLPGQAGFGLRMIMRANAEPKKGNRR